MAVSRVLVSGALAAAGVAAVRSAGILGDERVVSSGRRLGRNLRLARVGVKGSGRFAVTKAKKTFASAERKEALDLEFQIRTAEDVTAELGNMKGALMKLGQMASYVDVGLPPHVSETLASLQSDAPPMSGDLAAETIERELGKPVDQLFQEWDPIPIASASIGQVHRAITLDDRAVAVKVQYPGVAEAVSSDLQNADLLFGALGGMFPGLDTGPVVEELKLRLAEELDYENEAKNQRYFASFFDRHPFMHVPQVVDHLSTARILTSDLATGSSFDEVLTWSEEEKNLTAETIFRFSFGAIYRLHAFNGDPHPGNYLFQPGGKVTFLDFGLVKRFTPSETQLFQDLIIAMVIENDIGKFRRFVEDADLLSKNAPFTDAEVEDYFSFYYRYVMNNGPVTIDKEYAAGGVAQIFDSNGPQGELLKQLNVPPSFVILQRITLGLMGILAQLEATRNWRGIAEELWPFVDRAPTTPTGEAIEAWRRERGQSGLGL